MDYENIFGRQFFNFEKLDHSDSDDAYFDNKMESPLYGSNKKTVRKNEKDKDNVFSFSAKAISAPIQPKSREEVFKSVPVPVKSENRKSSTKANKRLSVPKLKPGHLGKRPPLARSSKSVPSHYLNKVSDNGISTKRTLPFANQNPSKRAKKTVARTPECLKRSMLNARKIPKSSEEIELEQIAYLRKETSRHLKSNRATMLKGIRGPAIQPIKPATAATTRGVKAARESQKNRSNNGINFLQPKVIRPKFNAALSKPCGNVNDISSFVNFDVPRCTSTPFIMKVRPEMPAENNQSLIEETKSSKKDELSILPNSVVAPQLKLENEHLAVPCSSKAPQMKVTKKPLKTENKAVIRASKESKPRMKPQVEALLKSNVAVTKSSKPREPRRKAQNMITEDVAPAAKTVQPRRKAQNIITEDAAPTAKTVQTRAQFRKAVQGNAVVAAAPKAPEVKKKSVKEKFTAHAKSNTAQQVKPTKKPLKDAGLAVGGPLKNIQVKTTKKPFKDEQLAVAGSSKNQQGKRVKVPLKKEDLAVAGPSKKPQAKPSKKELKSEDSAVTDPPNDSQVVSKNKKSKSSCSGVFFIAKKQVASSLAQNSFIETMQLQNSLIKIQNVDVRSSPFMNRISVQLEKLTLNDVRELQKTLTPAKGKRLEEPLQNITAASENSQDQIKRSRTSVEMRSKKSTYKRENTTAVQVSPKSENVFRVTRSSRAKENLSAYS